MKLSKTKAKLYAPLSDIQLVSRVLGNPHDYEAAHYLIYVRRYDDLKKRFFKVFTEQASKKQNDADESHDETTAKITYPDSLEFEDALSELYLHLVGEKGDCRNLRQFKGTTDADFKKWISTVARRKFLDFKFSLYQMQQSEEGSYISVNQSLDDMLNKYGEFIACGYSFDYDPKAREYELLRRQALLIDAISRLPDEQKIVVLGRLADKSSKDIAKDINYFRKTRGIIKRNNSGAIAVATETTVDNLFDRAKDSLKNKLNEFF